ncbi:hypothetical protein FW774_09530 [Pedobacter sp. BS3]|uniref:DUF6686 family protein n=1 Tax=Pedobacter sp. BS3 TaxID=2567937 RepID=UPI0011EFFFDD|nr:DUF6686 family protein [Pedobacter sp. BS3]TZF83706.1 hypothetical protein FW774_09530 [Pedobacter sp. BS3]
MCQTIVLSSKESVVISQCMDCKMLTIWHQNILLTFTPAQFRAFKSYTAKLNIEESLFPFPDGEERLILHTPYHDIRFTFTLEEWEDFKIALNEAVYMQNIYQMIY